MYTHILYPTDGSEHSQNALPHVIAMASKFNAKVSVLYAYNLALNMVEVHRLPVEIYNQITNSLKENGDAILREAKKQFQDEEIDVTTHKIEGNPKLVICEFARQKKCDLIIMGSRGLSQIGSASNLNLMGSNSVHVIIHTEGIPVLVVD